MALNPHTQDADMTLYAGDCLDVLRQLPDGSVHMCCTSPPFYGLRDYGTGSWEGGNPDCDHDQRRRERDPCSKQASNAGSSRDGVAGSTHCRKCGARRVDQQIGLEETPEQWVDRLVAVFREVRRVLRDDGTLWVEIGDSYVSNGWWPDAPSSQGTSLSRNQKRRDSGGKGVTRAPGAKPKDLLGGPWLLAFALRADGWYLRSEIIWARPNPMPESVTDRPTKAHSTVFLLSKLPRYFFDADAIREAYTDGNRGAGRGFRCNSQHYTEQNGPLDNTLGGLPPEAPRGPDGRRVTTVTGTEASAQHRDGERWPNPVGANARSVWTVATQSTPFAHFATWPERLCERMILAGTSERGVCPVCGAPWVRDVDHVPIQRYVTGKTLAKQAAGGTVNDSRTALSGAVGPSTPTRRTLGWSPSCDHDAQPVPATVLDPFAGSGTTMLVARRLGRRSVGIELNPEYLKLAAGRLAQLSLLAEPA